MMVVLCIFDDKLNAYLPETVSVFANSLVGLRAFANSLRRSPLAENAEDYKVYSLGQFDIDKGQFFDLDKPPAFLCSVSDLLHSGVVDSKQV